jgi:DNA-directed RNA polymerase subunit beta
MLRSSYIKNIEKILINSFENIEKKFIVGIEKIKTKVEKNVTLTHGVLQTVTVYITTKRKLKPGDKLSGRHGNKGVVSTVLPTEDMPYLPDGTPIDMILNPLGIPSRMNVGQMLEVQLGWALKTITNTLDNKNTAPERTEFLLQKLYKKKVDNISTIKTQTFKGITQEKIRSLLKIINLPKTGQIRLVNGRTGELTRKKVSVGYMYMLKLNHLADDKLHARSTGPYNIITQQPLGGKAHFGGQRFGEMEVWALEAYGAAYTLQEMVTVKADDLTGRTKMFKNIVDGNNKLEPTIPESFKVLLEEIRAIGLTLKLNT